ncbi:ATP-binding cassette permease mdl1 [Pichia californica]|uniref:ATP-binding cassette permease mdl1 n=1 Tax=Pichia californica TaxID=460514 RepID=A0A9P6WMA9_9ASCO|nr:ATP-binding cassette permease mdl1 [[Candida] californica]
MFGLKGSGIMWRLPLSGIGSLQTSTRLLIPRNNTSNTITNSVGIFSNSNYLRRLISTRRLTKNNVLAQSSNLGILKRIQCRWKSTSVASKSESEVSSTDKKETVKKVGSFKEITELLNLLKDEWPTLSFAIICLLFSSAVSMLFPTIMGKIIDTAKPNESEDGDESLGNFKVPKTIDILSYEIPINVFYGSLICVFAVGSLANFGRIVLLRKVGERIMAKLRVDIERNIFYQSSKFWDKYKSGDLISRLVNDSTVVTRSVTQNVSDGLRSTISGFVGIAMMLTISVKLTGYMFMIFPVLLFIALVFGRRVKKVSREIQQQLGSLTKVSEEQFSFVKTIQSFNNENYEVSKFQKEVQKLYDLSIYEGKLNGYFYSGNGFIGNSFLVCLLSVGVWMVRQGELSIGELSSYLMYTIYSASSVYSLSNFYSELMKGVGASERVFELLKLKPDIDPYVGKKASVDGDIIFQNIKFHYPTRENHQVFNGLNLTLRKGDHVCLVGPSGCGKSTVTQLLLRYYDPNSGKIFVNGNDLSELSLANFREQVGIVQQEPMLFSGTLRENIVYGRRYVSDEDIKRVCDLANCTSFINNFPDGLETKIGSKGAQLSGGQKQRIALARTLLLGAQVPDTIRKTLGKINVLGEDGRILLGPSVLILDEATSALDAHSEEAIKKTLQLRHKAGLTTISIAHRLSTINMSNRVIVFSQNGTILADGAFTEMISNPKSELNLLLNKSTKGDDTETDLTREEKLEEEEKNTEKDSVNAESDKK